MLAKTVVLVEAELLYRRPGSFDWIPLPDEGQQKITLDIFGSANNDWTDLTEHGILVSEYERQGSKTTFFFTSDESTHYLYEFNVHGLGKGSYALKTAIYKGRESDPRIISQADNQTEDLARQIGLAVNDAQEIQNLFKQVAHIDIIYKWLVESITRIIVMSIIMKVVVFYCTFYYFNAKLREFYVSKKIVK